MHERSDLTQHVNTLNKIITDLVRLGMTIDDKDKTIILLYSLPGPFDHPVTILIYGKYYIKLNDITAEL